MKKISPSRKIKLVAVAKRRWRKRLYRVDRPYRQKLPELTLAAPAILSFQENFSQTVSFLDDFRDATLARDAHRRRIHIDLKPIKRLSVPVAIVLAAEFHRWSLVRRFKLHVRDSHDWAPAVRNLLSDLGVFDLLGLKPVTAERGTDHFVLTRLISGEKTDGRQIDLLQAKFNGVLHGFTNNPEMFGGLMEAAENALLHGYPPDFTPRHRFAGHRWWAASCLDVNTLVLRFFVFDQGAGIPFTLPSATSYEHVREWLANATRDLISNDSVMLRAALEVGRTRTGLEHRGLGLKKMSDVVTGAREGRLRILSGKGEIVYHANESIETRDHDRPIGGTLIEWRIGADVFTSTPEEPIDENS